MITFIYGQDSYRSRQKLKDIIDGQKNTCRGGICLNYFEGQGLIFQNIKIAADNMSMFGEKNIVVLRDVFLNKNFKEEFLERAKEFLKSSALIFIYEEKEIDKRDALFKFLRKNVKCEEFPKLNYNGQVEWISEELAKYGQEISLKAKEKLVAVSADDLWLLENEIKKLIGFCRGRKIEEKDIDALVNVRINNDIFKTIDALARKNKKEALYLLHNHLQEGEPPLYLLSMINFQFRNLLEIKELIEKKISYSGILGRSSLHPFVVKKTYWLAREFSFSQLKKIYTRIFKTDLDVKTGKMEPEIALDLLITSI